MKYEVIDKSKMGKCLSVLMCDSQETLDRMQALVNKDREFSVGKDGRMTVLFDPKFWRAKA